MTSLLTVTAAQIDAASRTDTSHNALFVNNGGWRINTNEPLADAFFKRPFLIPTSPEAQQAAIATIALLNARGALEKNIGKAQKIRAYIRGKEQRIAAAEKAIQSIPLNKNTPPEVLQDYCHFIVTAKGTISETFDTICSQFTSAVMDKLPRKTPNTVYDTIHSSVRQIIYFSIASTDADRAETAFNAELEKLSNSPAIAVRTDKTDIIDRIRELADEIPDALFQLRDAPSTQQAFLSFKTRQLENTNSALEHSRLLEGTALNILEFSPIFGSPLEDSERVDIIRTAIDAHDTHIGKSRDFVPTAFKLWMQANPDNDERFVGSHLRAHLALMGNPIGSSKPWGDCKRGLAANRIAGNSTSMVLRPDEMLGAWPIIRRESRDTFATWLGNAAGLNLTITNT